MKNVTFIIKTLDRYICLKPLVKSIIKNYPNSPILIGDDGLVTCKKQIEQDFKGNKNIKVYELPYDSGLSYGRNYLVNKTKTKYICLCDDDFILDKKADFKSSIEILEKQNLDIIGGYLRNYKIESSFKDKIIKIIQKILHYELPTNYIGTINKKGKTLYTDYKIHSFPDYEEVDIVNNFFVAKTKSLKKCRWDEDLKLQEHTPFFYKAKSLGLKVGFTNKLSIRHCPIQNKKYKNFRTRNYTHVFMEKENINKIVSTYDDVKRNSITNINKINDILISVIIPVYNAKNKIDLLIKTLKDQTYKNFEVILVDNNSTDDSLSYIKKLVGKDKRFIITREKKQGPNYARKKGFEKSSGQYIYFCDADDYLEDDTLYHFACEITKNKSDIVIGDYVEHNSYNQKYMKGIYQDYNDNLKQHNDILLVKPALWNKILKRDLIDQSSFIFTYIAEDMLITILAMARAKKISYLNKIVYHYILDDNGLSSIVKYKNLINLVESQIGIINAFKKNKYYNKYKEELEYIFITHLIYRIFRSTLLISKKEKEEVYLKLIQHLDTLNINNKYLKSSTPFSISYKIVKNKVLFKILSPVIKALFTSKTLNKLLKKLDK